MKSAKTFFLNILECFVIFGQRIEEPCLLFAGLWYFLNFI